MSEYMGIWKLLYDWQTLITGVLTILFTAIVGVAAYRAANAARKSADALPRIERAYIFADGNIRHDIRTFQNGETTLGFNVWFILKNHGKTPAIVNGLQEGARYVANADPCEVAVKAFPIGLELVLAADETKEIGSILVITSDEYFSAVDSVGQIFLVSKIIYNDIFGCPHETGFCCQFDAVLGQWSVCPKKSLNYRT